MPEVNYRVLVGGEQVQCYEVEYDRDPVTASTVPGFRLKLRNIHGYHARRYYGGKQVHIYRLATAGDVDGKLEFHGVINGVKMEKTADENIVELTGTHYWFDRLSAVYCHHYRTHNGTYAPVINPWLFGRYAPSDTQADTEEIVDGLRPDEIIRAIIGTKFYYQEFFATDDAFNTDPAFTFKTTTRVKTDGSNDGELVLASLGQNYEPTGERSSVPLYNGPAAVSEMGEIIDVKATIKASLPADHSIENDIDIAFSRDGGNSFPSGWVTFVPTSQSGVYETSTYTFGKNLTVPSNYDASENRLNLTLVGFPTVTGGGNARWGNGIILDGVDDYAYNDTAGPLLAFQYDATIFLNFTLNQLPSAGKVAWILVSQAKTKTVNNVTSPDTTNIGLGLYVDDQGRLTYVHRREADTDFTWTSTNTFTPGTNYTLTLRRKMATKDKNGEVVINVNGAPWATAATTTLVDSDKVRVATTRAFSIGKYWNDSGTGTNQLLKANIFELRVWNWALPQTGDTTTVPTSVSGVSPVDILNHLHVAGPDDVGFWLSFNETSGTVMGDHSGYYNKGTGSGFGETISRLTSGNADVNIGGNHNRKVAQSFQVNKTCTLQREGGLKVVLKKVGTPSSNSSATIRVSSTRGSGGVTGTIRMSTLTTSYAEYSIKLNADLELTPGIPYYLSVEYTQGSVSEYVHWQYKDASDYTGGQASVSIDGSTWTEQPTWDMRFSVEPTNTDFKTAKWNNGVDLDGVDDHITIPHHSTVSPTTDIAIFCQHKPDALPILTATLLSKNESYAVEYDFQGTITAKLWVNGAWRSVSSTRKFSPNTWTSVGVTYSTTDATIRLVIDGQEDNSVTLTGLADYTIGQNSNTVYIGASAVSTNLVNGMLDEMVLWRSKKTVAELATVHQIGPKGIYPGMNWSEKTVGDEVACWFFDARTMDLTNRLVYKVRLNSEGGAGSPKVDYLKLDVSTKSDTGLYEGEIDKYVPTAGGSDLVSINLAGKTRLQALEEVRQLTVARDEVNPSPNWDLRISVDGRVDFKEVIGSDISLPDSPTGRLGPNNKNTFVIRRSVDALIGNVLIGKGAGTEPYAITLQGSAYKDQDSIGIYGTRVMTYADSSIADIVTLDNKLRAALKYYKTERESIEVDGRDYFAALDVGDFIYLDKDFVDVSERFRVMELSVRYDALSKSETFSAVLSNKALDGIANILNTVAQASENQKSIQQGANTGTQTSGIAVRFGKDQDGNWVAGKYMITVDDEDATRLSMYVRTEPFDAYAKAASTTLTDHTHGMEHTHQVPSTSVSAVTTATQVKTTLDSFQEEYGGNLVWNENLTKINAAVMVDDPTHRIGQLFQANDSQRLAAIQIHLWRTSGSMVPDDLQLRLYPNAYAISDLATMTGTMVTGDAVRGDANRTKDGVATGRGKLRADRGNHDMAWDFRVGGSDNTNSGTTLRVTYDFGSPIVPDGVTMSYSMRGSGTAKIEVEYSTDNSTWIPISGTAGGGTSTALATDGDIKHWASWSSTYPSARYWRLHLKSTAINSYGGITECGIWKRGAYNSSTRNMPASLGPETADITTTGINLFAVDGSLLSIGEGVVASSANWSTEVEWEFPNVQLTQNDWYWFVLSNPTGSTTKYWGATISDAATVTDKYAFWSRDNGVNWERAVGHNGPRPKVNVRFDDGEFTPDTSPGGQVHCRDVAGSADFFMGNTFPTNRTWVTASPLPGPTPGYLQNSISTNASVAEISQTHSNVGSLTDSFSMAFWLYIEDWPTAVTDLITNGGTSPTTGWRVRLHPSSTAKLEFDSISGGVESANLLSSTLSLNTWYHFTLTYDNAAQEVKIYKNGVIDATATGIASMRGTTADDITFRFKRWRFYDFRNYDYVLNSDSALSHYRIGTNVKPCLAYRLRFGEDDAEVKTVAGPGYNRWGTKFIAAQATNEFSVYHEVFNNTDSQKTGIKIKVQKKTGGVYTDYGEVTGITIGPYSSYKYYTLQQVGLAVNDEVHMALDAPAGQYILRHARNSATEQHSHNVTGATTAAATSGSSSAATTASGGGSHTHDLVYGIYRFKGDTPGVNPVYPTKLRVYIGDDNYTQAIALDKLGEFGFSDKAYDSGIVDISNVKDPNGNFVFRHMGPNGAPGRFKPGMYPVYIVPTGGDSNNANGLGKAVIAHVVERVKIGA